MLHQPVTGQIRLLSDSGSALRRPRRPGHGVSRVSQEDPASPACPSREGERPCSTNP